MVRLGAPIAFLLAAAAGLACAPEPRVPQHLLVIVVDTLRADALGVYGNPENTSPRIDQLAEESLVFERAWAQGTYTPSSYVSYMSSTHVRTHGWDYDLMRYPRPGICGWTDLVLLPELLAEHGFITTGLAANPVLQPKHGFTRGFASWNGVRVVQGEGGPRPEAPHDFMDDEAVTLRAIEHVSSFRPGERHFLYVHLMGPHLPLRPSADARERFDIGEEDLDARGIDHERIRDWRKSRIAAIEDLVRDAYHASVFDADRAVGRILDALDDSGHGDDTIVVVMADHGEELYERSAYGHASGVWETLAHVPLIIRAPGLAPRRIGDRAVALIDVAPTVSELLGLSAAPASWQGGTLLDQTGPRAVFVQRFGEVAVSVDGSLKAMKRHKSSWRYFSLRDDPGETMPLVSVDGADELMSLHHRWDEQTPRNKRNRRADPVGLCANVPRRELGRDYFEERLRELGYAE